MYSGLGFSSLVFYSKRFSFSLLINTSSSSPPNAPGLRLVVLLVASRSSGLASRALELDVGVVDEVAGAGVDGSADSEGDDNACDILSS